MIHYKVLFHALMIWSHIACAPRRAAFGHAGAKSKSSQFFFGKFLQALMYIGSIFKIYPLCLKQAAERACRVDC